MAGLSGGAARLAGAALWLALAGLSAHVFLRDAAGRGEALAFAREWGFDVRRPGHLEQVPLEATAADALGLMCDAAVADEVSPVPWRDLDATERAAWLDALARREEMLRAAHRLALAAVAEDPGFALQAYRAGQLGYLVARREGAEALRKRLATWHLPLRHATRLAPGFEGSWAFLSAALLEAWPILPEELRRDGRDVLARAFLDPEFARRAFLPVTRELGLGPAMGLVPEVPGPLAAAAREVTAEGNVDAAAALLRRWEEAERKARAAELARLEERFRMRDEDALRAGCRAFVAAHPFRELTGPEAPALAARLLELWPHDGAGAWRTDGRAELLRVLLEASERRVNRAAVTRAAEALLDVPETERARLYLLAENRYGWERVVRESKTVGALEWTTFFAELARAEAADGRLDPAAEALGRIAPRAREECAVLVARRDWAEAAAERDAIAEAERELAAAREGGTGTWRWSSSFVLPLCVDPKADAGAELRLALPSSEPALLAWELNGRRGGSFRTGPEATTISVPLGGLQGVAVVSLSVLAGPRPALVSASRQAAAAAPATSASVTPVAGSERLNSTRP